MIKPTTAKWIFDSWQEEREQLGALAFCLLHALTPEDANNPADSENIHAWRLAQVMTDLLSDCRNFNAQRDAVLGADHE